MGLGMVIKNTAWTVELLTALILVLIMTTLLSLDNFQFGLAQREADKKQGMRNHADYKPASNSYPSQVIRRD